MAQPPPFDAKEIKRRMHGAVEALKHDFGGLRTGRASVSLRRAHPCRCLWRIDAAQPGGDRHRARAAACSRSRFGTGASSIAVEKAIRASNLGLNPQTEGQVIRLRMPDLTQDRRKELVKVAHQYAEKARIAVRNVRRDGMEHLKTLEKGHLMSEDEHRDNCRRGAEDDRRDDQGDRRALKTKEGEIMQV